jgi:hypothetical protein
VRRWSRGRGFELFEFGAYGDVTKERRWPRKAVIGMVSLLRLAALIVKCREKVEFYIGILL